MNVSGHRLGSAEIESALVAHDDVSEAAVIGIPHDVKGYVWAVTERSSRHSDALLLFVAAAAAAAAAALTAVSVCPSLPCSLACLYLHSEGLCCYVTLVSTVEERPDHVDILRKQVRAEIGPFATPEYIIVTSALPKTRSGKIMRRILRKLITKNENLGDITTLADPTVVERLKAKVLHALETQTKKPKKK